MYVVRPGQPAIIAREKAGRTSLQWVAMTGRLQTQRVAVLKTMTPVLLAIDTIKGQEP